MHKLINNPLFKQIQLDKRLSGRYIAFKPNKSISLTKADLSILLNDISFQFIINGVLYFSIPAIKGKRTDYEENVIYHHVANRYCYGHISYLCAWH